ncbi:restriction endonuclease subunit S [Polaribacter aquimarinus]|uniref:Restriction endonuclease subunit S n=1 Tax=Polaribacter aquimarinus TaxID=2100726 RepID=A0A2U2J7U5_9FLAO|nr:restriction endonuclease subunit S [Polaribacter aquimarinus]PWG04397.1 restriction endonuclease subunit S [Polaribacter aquimarinus]
MSQRDTNNIKKQEQKDCFVPRNDNQEVIENGVKQSAHKKEIASARLLSTSQHELRNDVRVPKLRFKEFEGEWHKKKLNTKIDFIAGYAFKSKMMKNFESKYQLLKMSNIYKSELQLDRNPSYWEKIDDKLKKYLLKKKDILLTLTGTVGKKDYGYSIVIPKNDRFLLNQRLVCLRAKTNISDADFINNLIKTSKFYYSFFNESKGGTGNQTNVGVDDLRNIKLLIPSFQEQQKIASFLAAVDTKIQQLTTKKELLENYKKGAMQQLFSQQLRFKNDDGTDFPDWEEKRLGEVGKIITGKTPSTSDEKLWNGEIQFITPTDIQENIKFQTQTKRTVVKNKRLNILPINSIVYTCIASIGKMCLTTKESITNQQINSIIPYQKYNYEYVYYYLLFLTPKIKSTQANTTLPIINKTDFSKFKIKTPSLKEQQKIANYLSALDKKITNVALQITNTQTFKKGLLQQLFV